MIFVLVWFSVNRGLLLQWQLMLGLFQSLNWLLRREGWTLSQRLIYVHDLRVTDLLQVAWLSLLGGSMRHNTERSHGLGRSRILFLRPRRVEDVVLESCDVGVRCVEWLLLSFLETYFIRVGTCLHDVLPDIFIYCEKFLCDWIVKTRLLLLLELCTDILKQSALVL